MWRSNASAISEKPISRRKERASILIVGWRDTKELIGVAANIITPTAITTAAIITPRWLAMPTAVITESSEKMMLSRRIWTITERNEADAAAVAPSSSPSSLSWISRVDL